MSAPIPLFVRVAGPNGEPLNGGKEAMPIDGSWSPVRNPVLCKSGWHCTDRPDRFGGLGTNARLWLVDVRGKVVSDSDKCAWESVRCRGPLDPDWPLLPMKPYVRVVLAIHWRREHPSKNWPSWANLSWANLSEANLSGANLSEAYLSGADLGSWERGANGYAKHKEP